MRSVEIRNGRLFYYGSAVGYLEGDGLFRREDLERWLERKNLPVRWVDGVYDRLANGESIQNAQPLKSLRIWQLKPDTPIEMRFIGLDRMAREFDGPNPSQYRIAYDGQAESQELEDIWNKFCRRTLPGGDHPLAIRLPKAAPASTDALRIENELALCFNRADINPEYMKTLIMAAAAERYAGLNDPTPAHRRALLRQKLELEPENEETLWELFESAVTHVCIGKGGEISLSQKDQKECAS